jgi:hypothetical protein
LVNIDKPDFVITSQGARNALTPNDGQSMDAMVQGMRASWSAVVKAGSEVIVIADNPYPGFNVYECVDEHRNDLSACTYDRDRLATSGAYSTQLRAVEAQPGVHIVNLFDAICPTTRCSPVIGNVLIYRQGSHITRTYIETLTPRLAQALSAAGLPAHYDASRQ